MKKKLTLTVISTALTLVILMIAVSSSEDNCNLILNKTTILSNDIQATDNCLNILEDDITLDCNFHTIHGDNGGNGITISDHTNINLINCIVENFNNGILIDNSTVRIYYSNIINNSNGIFIQNNGILDGNYNSLSENTLNINAFSGIATMSYSWWGTTDILSTISGSVIYDSILSTSLYSDDDLDGNPYIIDNCPSISNPSQSDIENDTIGDVCDNCLAISNKDQLNNDNDTHGDLCDPDDDNDNINDTSDNCIFIGNPLQDDTDSDNVGDACDNCINDKNPDQSDDDNDGKGNACDMNLFLITGAYDPKTESSNIATELTTYISQDYFIIQFNKTTTMGWETPLGLDITVLSYIPENAWLVESTESLLTLQGIDDVRDVILFHPAFKLSEDLYRRYNDGTLDTTEEIVLEVYTFKNTTIGNVATKIALLGGTVQETLDDDFDNRLDVTIGMNMVINISKIGMVSSIEEFFPEEERNNVAVGITKINYVRSNFFKLTGNGEKIAVFDSGLDTGNPATIHKDFENRVSAASKTYGGKPNWNDTGGHGTHVAGTALGSGARSGGTYKGVAYEADLLVHSGWGRGSHIASSFSDAYADGARIHTNSWGSDSQTYGAVNIRIDRWLNNNKNLTVTWAAPNSYKTNVGKEDLSKNIITVGATENVKAIPPAPTTGPYPGNYTEIHHATSGWRDGLNYSGIDGQTRTQADRHAEIAKFSGRGPTGDNRIKPDVVAPGAWVMSTRSSICIGKKDVDGDGDFDHDDCVSDGLPGSPIYGYRSPTYASIPLNRSDGGIVDPLYGVLNKPNDIAAYIAAVAANSTGGPWTSANFTVRSTTPIPANPPGPGSALHSRYYMFMGGTSMATPHVAGMVALIRQYLKMVDGLAAPTSPLLKAFIINGAVDMNRLANNNVGFIPDRDQGWGRVSLNNSITPCKKKKCIVYKESTFTNANQHVNMSIRANNKTKLELTLVWLDFEGTAVTNGRLVNDLDMTLVSPSGKVYMGGVNSFINGESDWGWGRDNENNVEKLLLYRPEDGIYNISISSNTGGTGGLPQPPTDWALVISGMGGIDAVNSSGNYTTVFSIDDEMIYARLVGWINDSYTRVRVMPHKVGWTIGDQLFNHVNSTWNTTDENGTIINFPLLNISDPEKIINTNGSYNIVVDEQPYYDFDLNDMVDYNSRPGFKVKAIGSTNSSNIYDNRFEYKEEVWYKGVGLVNDTNMHAYVIPYDSTINWNNRLEIINFPLRGFDVLSDTNHKGVIQGEVFPTSTISINDLFADKGTYTTILDVDGNGFYNKSVDLVDKKGEPGFYVTFLNTTNSTGYSDIFEWGDSIGIKAVGISEPLVDVYVLEHKSTEWEEGNSLATNKAIFSDVTRTSGKIEMQILENTRKSDLGKYDVIIDVNKNGLYEPKTDIINGKGGTDFGFLVKCQDGKEICGMIESSDQNGNVKDSINEGETVYANIVVYSEVGGTRTIYIMNKNGDITTLNGQPLVDVSTDGTETITLTAGEATKEVKQIWANANDLGYYEIILDANNSLAFEFQHDIFDVNGFTISEQIYKPKIGIAPNGDIHVIALKELPDKIQIVHSKVPASSQFGINRTDFSEDYWSTDKALEFQVIREEHPSRNVRYLDMAVDEKGGIHIVYDITVPDYYSAGYKWIKYIKLNSSGRPDLEFDKFPGRAVGQPFDLLVYNFESFFDPDVSNPSITVDNTHDPPLPVIAANVDVMYPDRFYLDVIYPQLFLTTTPIFPVHPLVPIFYVPEIVGLSTVFYGESVQVARYDYGGDGDYWQSYRDGGIQWPFGWDEPGADTDCTSTFNFLCLGCNCNSRSGWKYSLAMNEVSRVTADIASSSPVKDNWHWIPIDEIGMLGTPGPTLFWNSKAAVDDKGDIHVVYPRRENKPAYGTTYMYYSKVHGGSRSYAAGVKPTHVPNSELSSLAEPSIAVFNDPTGAGNHIAHFVWEGFSNNEPGIYYARSDNLAVKKVASLDTLAKHAHPTVTVDSKGNPKVVWIYYTAGLEGHLKIKKGEDLGGSTFFENSSCTASECGTELVRSDSYIFPPNLEESMVAGTQSPDLWNDVTAITYLDLVRGARNVKVKRTLPKFVVWITIDGMSNSYLETNLNSMPTLKRLMQESPTVRTTIDVGYPSTMSSLAQMFTGLEPNNNNIIADNFFLSSSNEFMSGTPADEINNILYNSNVDTIFKFLIDRGHSVAAINNIINKDIIPFGDNRVTPIIIDLETGTITDPGDVSTYISQIDNTDADALNNGVELLTFHLIANDHGKATTVGNMNPVAIDNQILDIVQALSHDNMLNDTIFMITSDHGYTDVNESGALDKTGNWMTGLDPNKLFLNGRFAFYYTPSTNFESDIAPIAEFFYNESKKSSSDLYQKIENIIVLNDSEYFNYNKVGNKVSLTWNFDPDVEKFLNIESPTIILEAKTLVSGNNKYYFQTQRKAMAGISYTDSIVPLILTGEGLRNYGGSRISLTHGLKAVDVPLVAAYFFGGLNFVNDLAPMLDSGNPFSLEFELGIASPVNIALYDEKGKSTGYINDKIVEEIPGSLFYKNDKRQSQTITVSQKQSNYRAELTAYDKGPVHLYMKTNKPDFSSTVTFPEFEVDKNSKAIYDMTNSNYTLSIDYDGDGNFEKTLGSNTAIVIKKGTDNANITLGFIAQGESVEIDLRDHIGISIQFIAPTDLNNKYITIKKLYDDSLDATGFYTLDEYYSVTLDSEIGDINLTIIYSENKADKKSIDEKKMSMYESGWSILNSNSDTNKNSVTATITGSSNYLVASSNQAPIISEFTLSPKVTNQPGTDITISAKVTDEKLVKDVIAHVGNRSKTLALDSGYYKGTIEGSQENGVFTVKLIASDYDNNTATRQGSVSIDLEPPKIHFTSPTNSSYITNHIELMFNTDELSNQSYKIDNEPYTLEIEKKAFVNTNKWYYDLPSGIHNFTVYARDSLGNHNSESISFEIERQNIAVTDMQSDFLLKPNKEFIVRAKLSNTLITSESDIEVQLRINNISINNQFHNLSGEKEIDIMFTHSLPAGRYNLSIHSIPLENETYTEDNNLSMEILVTNKIPILLVDDSTKDTGSYIDSIHSTANPAYIEVLWNLSQKSLPSLEYANNFELILWITNKDLDYEKIDFLKQYLDNNKYLAIFSDTLGQSSADTDFYKDYLKASYKGKIQSTTIEGVYRDDIGHNFLFAIQGTSEMIAIDNTDNNTDNTTSSLKFAEGDLASIKTEQAYKAYYQTFDMANVVDINEQNHLMQKILDWFNIDIYPPKILNISPLGLSPSDVKFPKDTNNITLSVRTDEIAICYYSHTDSGINFATAFQNTNDTTHETILSGLANGNNYTVYIYCQDKKENTQQNVTSFYIWDRTFLPPTIQNISDMVYFEDDIITITLNATDPENDPLTYHIEDIEFFGYTPFAHKFQKTNTTINIDCTNQTNCTNTSTTYNSFTYDSYFHDAGTYHIRAKVDDGNVNITTDFILIIINVNQPPILSPIGNQILHEDTFYFNTITSTDIDHDELRYYDDSLIVDIHSFTGEIAFNPKPKDVGTHMITISVTDGFLWDSELVNFTILETNDPPILDFVSPQYAHNGQLFNMTVEAFDPENDSLTFSDDSTFFNITSLGEISFTPNTSQVISQLGAHYINITVSDGELSDSKILNLVISADNRPPIYISVPDLIITKRNALVKINVTACDPDSDPMCGG